MKKYTILLIVGLIVAFFYFLTILADDTRKKLDKASEMRLAITSITPLVPEEELVAIQDTSSESKGRWVGLCKKDSIYSVEDFQNQVMADPVLVKHFEDFLWSRAILTELDDVTYAQVAHRSGSTIKPTRRILNLPKGDRIITDGFRIVRAHCCNDVYLVEKPPPNTVTYNPPVKTYPPIYTPDTPSITPPVYYSYPNTSRGYVDHDKPNNPPSPAPVPEPTTLLLFGTGLCALAFFGRKK